MRETNDTQHTFRMSRGGGRTKSRAESAEHAEKASELISRRERRARREETLRTHLAQRAQSTQRRNSQNSSRAESAEHAENKQSALGCSRIEFHRRRPAAPRRAPAADAGLFPLHFLPSMASADGAVFA